MVNKQNILQSLKIFNTITFIYGLTDQKLNHTQTKYKNCLIIFILTLISYSVILINYGDQIFYEKTFRSIFMLLQTFYFHSGIVFFLIYTSRNRNRLYGIFKKIDTIDRKLQLNLSCRKLFGKLNDSRIIRLTTTFFFIIAFIKDVREILVFSFDLLSSICAVLYSFLLMNIYQLLKIQIFLYVILLCKRFQLLHKGKFLYVL